MMPNVLQYPVAVAGILRAGMVVVNVNPLYTPRELEHQVKDAGVRAIVVLENFAHTVAEMAAHRRIAHVCVAAMGDLMGAKGPLVNFVVPQVKKMVPAWSLPGHVSFRSALRPGRARALAEAGTGPTTSPSCNTPAARRASPRARRSPMPTSCRTSRRTRHGSRAAFLTRPEPERMTYLCALPLYHIFALTVNMLMGIREGAHNILIPNPRDIPGLVKEMARHEINVFPGLNTLFNALLAFEDFASLDFRPLILTLAGGMAVQRPVAERWKAVTGCHIAEGYGLSETSPVVSANRFDVTEFTGTIGLPLPSTEIDIRDDAGNSLRARRNRRDLRARPAGDEGLLEPAR